ncbi:MAG TPA: radical SAM protein [Candidatus Latescibacteria bacterium]|nr:radical SAM protein [Candidatus Latescibacterota bacterium]
MAVLTTARVLSHPKAADLISTLVENTFVRKFLIKALEKEVYKRTISENVGRRLRRAQEDKFYMVRSMILALDRAFRDRLISPEMWGKIFKVFVGNIFVDDTEWRDAFVARHGQGSAPPAFITISPGKRCNLQCVGCYAGSTAADAEKLEYDLVSRVIRDKTKKWASHFTVISGGEPLMWRSQGKGILDLAREHQDNYFLMYTNGTLIDERVAEDMAELGNISPAISVEGFEEETEERRGKGVYEKILRAFRNLRKVGVPFGISITATRFNVDTLTKDEFWDFYMLEQGALYAWIFQYMPIGRKYTLDLLVTPEQRLRLYEYEMHHLLRERGLWVADFWNGGPVSDGCISAGRTGGYLYIEWNGNVTPCVFFPYAVDNVKDIYARGDDIDVVLDTPLFKAIRRWQNAYSYLRTSEERMGNQLAPCPIRDHFRVAYSFIRKFGGRPIDKDAEDAINDPEYVKGMIAYGERVRELLDKVWKEEYLLQERKKTMAEAAG